MENTTLTIHLAKENLIIYLENSTHPIVFLTEVIIPGKYNHLAVSDITQSQSKLWDASCVSCIYTGAAYLEV